MRARLNYSIIESARTAQIQSDTEVPFGPLPAPQDQQFSLASATAAASAVQPAQDLNSLIGQAGKDFSEYQRLTADGKLAEAGQKLQELKQVIEKLNAQKK